MNLIEKYNRLKQLKNNIRKMGLSTLVATKDDYISINKEEIKDGKNVQGFNIGEYKSESYKILKTKMNPRANGRVDLYYEGSFLLKMRLGTNGYSYNVKSTDSKNDMLVAKYGSDVPFFGLEGERMDYYRREYFYPYLMVDVRTLLNG